RPGPQRLQKLLAAAGVASRRAAEEFVRAGRVTVNGRRARLGDSADPQRDVIALDGKPLGREPLAYWMLHKPRGVLTTVRDSFGRPTVMDLLPRRGPRLFPVGRLDRDTEGLVLLTNDGELAHALLHPSHGIEREYRVTVRGRVSAPTLRRLEAGVELDDGVTAPARAGRADFAKKSGTTRFSLTLTEGRKRQIRRALRALGHPVVRLVRVRIGPLRLARVAVGSARPLAAPERRALLQAGRAARGAGRARGSLSQPRAAARAKRPGRG
ncbi:MAG: pseudouridine synthase, partial [Myxococcota bacterium]